MSEGERQVPTSLNPRPRWKKSEELTICVLFVHYHHYHIAIVIIIAIMIDDDDEMEEEEVTNMIAVLISGGDLFIDMVIAD